MIVYTQHYSKKNNPFSCWMTYISHSHLTQLQQTFHKKQEEMAYFKRAKWVLVAEFGQWFVVVQKEWNMLLRQRQAAVVQLWRVAAVLDAVCGGDGFISADQAQSYQQQHSPSSHMEGTTLALSTYNHL